MADSFTYMTVPKQILGSDSYVTTHMRLFENIVEMLGSEYTVSG